MWTELSNVLEGVTETKVVNQKANTYKLRNQSAKGFKKKKNPPKAHPKKPKPPHPTTYTILTEHEYQKRFQIQH